MMLDENKAIVRRLYEECWNQGKVDILNQIIAPDCRFHDPVFPSLGAGPDNLAKHVKMCRTAFPDLRFTIDDVIAEREEVVVHWTGQGTQRAQFLGIQPTERRATVSGTSISRLKNGKIVEQFADWNLMTMLEQLGVATAPKVQVGARQG